MTSSVKNDKLTSIYCEDANVEIPVYWAASAQEIYWNNAIILGTTIARRIEKSNVWDGQFRYREKVDRWIIKPKNRFKMPFFKTIITALDENLLPGLVKRAFSEEVGYWILRGVNNSSIFKLNTFKSVHEIFPSAVGETVYDQKRLFARNVSTRKIYIETVNPIKLRDGTSLITDQENPEDNDIVLYTSFGSNRQYLNIKEVSVENSRIYITLADDEERMTTTENLIVTEYFSHEGEAGKILDCFNNNVEIPSILTSFRYNENNNIE